MYMCIWNTLKDDGVHVIVLVCCDILMEIAHEDSPLVPLAATITDLSREILHYSKEWRHGKERADPAVIPGA